MSQETVDSLIEPLSCRAEQVSFLSAPGRELALLGLTAQLRAGTAPASGRTGVFTLLLAEAEGFTSSGKPWSL